MVSVKCANPNEVILTVSATYSIGEWKRLLGKLDFAFCPKCKDALPDGCWAANHDLLMEIRQAIRQVESREVFPKPDQLVPGVAS